MQAILTIDQPTQALLLQALADLKDRMQRFNNNIKVVDHADRELINSTLADIRRIENVQTQIQQAK